MRINFLLYFLVNVILLCASHSLVAKQLDHRLSAEEIEQLEKRKEKYREERNRRAKIIERDLQNIHLNEPAPPGSIYVDIDDYRHVFEGVGGTLDMYAKEWLALDAKHRNKAAKLVAKDLNLVSVKNYIAERPDVVPELYKEFAESLIDIKKFNPDIKVQVCVRNLPDDLEIKAKNGVTKKGRFDDTDPDIFKKIARYYFDVLVGFHNVGIKVDQLELLNEPGGVAKAKDFGRLFDQSVDELEVLISDSSINTYKLEMPQIVGPSLWSVRGIPEWLDVLKNDMPNAWENIDVVSTHGYMSGWFEGRYRNAANAVEGKPFINNEQTAKLKKGDGLYKYFGRSDPDFIGDVSIGLRLSDAINGGVNQFYIFQLNNILGNGAALIKTNPPSTVEKSKVYSGFKQITSLQPKNTHVISNERIDMGNNRVVAFRPKDKNIVYVNVTNITDKPQPVDLYLTRSGNKKNFSKIKSLKVIVSDMKLDESVVVNENYEEAMNKVSYTISPFSVTSFVIQFVD